MGSVYRRGKKLYFKVKVDGVWRGICTEFVVGQERAAREMLDRLEERRAAGMESLGDFGPVSMQRFADAWIAQRKLHVRTWKNDDAVLRLHVLPTLGAMKVDEIRPKHIVDLVMSWRTKPADERLAPKSIYNAYSTVSALFRDAALEGLIEASPCKLTKRQLGPKVDKDPEWRQTALFTLAELELLISDDRVSMDRRVLYALEGIAGMRHGEAAGLLWRNVQLELAPLGMIYVANNYEHPMPKGDVCRPVPVHATLAAILAEWRLHGWARMMGRQPTPEDLVLPLPPEAQSKHGRWRRKGYSYDRLEKDLVTLGLRHRRGHDLRRTMISLCRSAGANRDILRRATHKPPREVMEGYTSFEWDVVCAEVAKHPIRRASPATVITLPRVVNGGPESLGTGLGTADRKRADPAVEMLGPPRTRTRAIDAGEASATPIVGSVSQQNQWFPGGGVETSTVEPGSRGTKVTRPPRRLVESLISIALEAGAPTDHPGLVEARAWLAGGET